MMNNNNMANIYQSERIEKELKELRIKRDKGLIDQSMYGREYVRLVKELRDIMFR